MKVLNSKSEFYDEFNNARPPEIIVDSTDGYAIGRLMRGYRSNGGIFVIFHSSNYCLGDLELFVLLAGFEPVIAYEQEESCGIYAKAK